MKIEKIKILLAVLELPDKALPNQPIHQKNEANGLDWQCYLAGSSKMAPRIFIFSITDYSLELDFIAS